MEKDTIAAAVIATINAAGPFLVLINVLHWNAEQLAGFGIFATTVVTLGGLIFARKKNPAV